MNIEEFQNRIMSALPRDEYGFVGEDLEIWINQEGTISARYKGESIPCESFDWSDGLTEICIFVEHREQKAVQVV